MMSSPLSSSSSSLLLYVALWSLLTSVSLRGVAGHYNLLRHPQQQQSSSSSSSLIVAVDDDSDSDEGTSSESDKTPLSFGTIISTTTMSLKSLVTDEDHRLENEDHDNMIDHHPFLHNNNNNDIDDIPKCTPQHVHWSPATNVDEIHDIVNMTLSFTLDYDPYCSAPSAQVSIFYGPNLNRGGHYRIDENDSDANVEILQFSYNGYRFRTYESSYIHHVVIPRMEANTEYWYRIQVEMVDEGVKTDDESDTATAAATTTKQRVTKKTTRTTTTPTYKMTTPPSVATTNSPITIALVGDWGMTKQSVQTMERMLNSSSLSAVIVAGDLSYANTYLPYWQTWLQVMEPLFRSTSLLVAPGNHEIECDHINGNIFQAYESYFRNPNRIGPAEIVPLHKHGINPILTGCANPSEFLVDYQNGNSYSSYRHGSLLQIILLNSYTNTTKGSNQYNWLQQELEEYDKKRRNNTAAPWLLVVFHCPFHTTFRGHNNETNPAMMFQHMEPLFVEYKVNIVLSGHNHAYVRSHPMVGNNVDTHDGIVYLTIGTGGASHSRSPLKPTPEDWVANRDETTFGYGELHVVNRTHAHFRRVLNEDDDNNYNTVKKKKKQNSNNDDREENDDEKDDNYDKNTNSLLEDAVWLENNFYNT